ncbi:MAG: aminoglycoside phosphotransferase family protein [Candidatus Binataceae bacterium]
MSKLPTEIAAALIEDINRTRVTSFRTADAALAGESGASRIILDQSGREHLLKWGAGDEFRLDDAIVITAELVRRGYPIPAYLLTGSNLDLRWAIRPMFPGRTMDLLDRHHLARILDLNQTQAGAGASLSSDWPARIVESVLEGFQGWCVLDTFKTHSVETAAMLSQMQDYARTAERSRFESRDAVHFDFHTQNILVEDGDITAVIDWEGCCAGDRAFDLATLLFYSYELTETRAPLWERLREIASAEVSALYLSHMIVRQLDWSIRRHGAAIVPRYFAIAREVLRDLRTS